MQKELNAKFNGRLNCSVAFKDSQVGSIMNGANVLFAMPQFDQEMSVSKREYEKDNTSIYKKLF